MNLIILLPVVAAFFISLRDFFQRDIRKQFDSRSCVIGITFSDTIFILCIFGLVFCQLGFKVHVPLKTLILIGCQSIFHIVGIVLALELFMHENLMASRCYIRTSNIQTVLLSIPIFGYFVSFWEWVGILVSFVGVIVLSGVKLNSMSGILKKGKPALIGLSSAFCFSVSVLFFEHNIQTIGYSKIQNIIILATLMKVAQSTICISYLSVKKDFSIVHSFIRSKKSFIKASSISMLCFLTGYGSIVYAGIVNHIAISQIDVVFSFIFTIMLTKDKITAGQIIGSLLVAGGVLSFQLCKILL